MALPHFTNISTYKNIPADIIYKNLIDFVLETDSLDKESLEFLYYNCISLEKNILTFNINEDLKTYNILNKIIKEKTLFNLTIKRHNRDGEIFMIIELMNVNFTSFLEDIYDFNYAEQDILKISVNIKYDKKYTYTNMKQYLRTKKLKNVLQF